MNTSSFRRTSLPVLLVTALVAAGCGSDKKDDTASYKTDYNAESVKIKKIGDDLGVAINGASKMTDAQVETTFAALARRTKDGAAAILDLSPPAELKADNAALSTALAKAATDLEDIVTAAATGDLEAAKTATQTLIADSTPIVATREKLDAATAK